MTKLSSWQNFKKNFLNFPELGISLDTSLIKKPDVPPNYLKKLFEYAFKQMQDLEKGSIANPDENSMVGHYWLRKPEIAPTVEIKNKINTSIKKIKKFAAEIHQGKIKPQNSETFENLLLIGIGGSILGQQFLQNALCSNSDRMNFFFLDNTDPDGIDQVMNLIGQRLKKTLTLVTSKSGETIETRNAMLEVSSRYKDSGLDFSKHAVIITKEDSQLDILTKNKEFLDRFPMWEWVGGRTSILSPVGLLPMALQGIDIEMFLKGAKEMDELTRLSEVKQNPAAMLAWIWYHVGEGRGKKAMVILPYKDRLIFFSRYLQQLVMESLGKEKDLEGNKVHQGLTVFGNKGSTDQHSLVQQLREGPANYFVNFIEVLKDRDSKSLEFEPGITSGDFLHGFLLGTRSALSESGHESICITMKEINALTLGALIALFERTVGIYAYLIGINAYNQPGVEDGKKAAENVIKLLKKIQKHLKSYPELKFTAPEIADAIGENEKTETIFRILLHLSVNSRVKIFPKKTPFSHVFQSN